MHRRDILKIPGVGPVIGFGYRVSIVGGYGLRRAANFLGETLGWLARSREHTNLTYDLTEQSRGNIAATIAVVAGVSVERVFSLFEELENDAALQRHIRDVTLASPHRIVSDLPARYGRRLGWYALVRLLKPKIVMETGVDKGMGSCLLAAALMRNSTEGYPGYYYGTDINPYAGFLLTGDYAKFGEILYGDSIESIGAFEQKIDLFINDSDHSSEYEYKEYVEVQEKLAPGAIILGDNCDLTDKLRQFARETGRQFIIVSEQPVNHWAPGGAIGLAYAAR